MAAINTDEYWEQENQRRIFKLGGKRTFVSIAIRLIGFTRSLAKRIESNEVTFFGTIRCRNSRLWFANNPKLKEIILAYPAKYLEAHSVELYDLAIERNQTQDWLTITSLSILYLGLFPQQIGVRVAKLSPLN